MYRDLGFIRVWGGAGRAARASARRDRAGAPYAYLSTRTSRSSPTCRRPRELLNEYCVAFPDETRPYGSARLPDSDDVLAKWMALTGDERRLIATANMHLPGRQVDPEQVRRDLWRLQPVGARARAGAAAAAAKAVSPRREPPARTASTSSTAAAPSPRGPSAPPRAPTCKGIGYDDEDLAKPIIGVAHDVDRDDAVQLPPARARREGQGGHPRGRRHADGAQHDRDLRRHHDGHRRA